MLLNADVRYSEQKLAIDVSLHELYFDVYYRVMDREGTETDRAGIRWRNSGAVGWRRVAVSVQCSNLHRGLLQDSRER